MPHCEGGPSSNDSPCWTLKRFSTIWERRIFSTSATSQSPVIGHWLRPWHRSYPAEHSFRTTRHSRFVGEGPGRRDDGQNLEAPAVVAEPTAAGGPSAAANSVFSTLATGDECGQVSKEEA